MRPAATNNAARQAEAPATALEFLGFITLLRDGGFIPQSSHSIAVGVLHHMELAKQRQAYLSLRQISNGVFMTGGRVVAPPLPQSYFPLIEGLQSLHFGGRVFSGLSELELSEVDFKQKHFTLSPRVEVGCHWTRATPLLFRLSDDSPQALNLLLENRRRHFYCGVPLIEWGAA